MYSKDNLGKLHKLMDLAPKALEAFRAPGQGFAMPGDHDLERAAQEEVAKTLCANCVAGSTKRLPADMQRGSGWTRLSGGRTSNRGALTGGDPRSGGVRRPEGGSSSGSYGFHRRGSGTDGGSWQARPLERRAAARRLGGRRAEDARLPGELAGAAGRHPEVRSGGGAGVSGDPGEGGAGGREAAQELKNTLKPGVKPADKTGMKRLLFLLFCAGIAAAQSARSDRQPGSLTLIIRSIARRFPAPAKLTATLPAATSTLPISVVLRRRRKVG